MGWISNLIGAGILAANVSQAATLSEMQRQNADAATIQALLRAMRDEVFKFREAIKEALTLEARHPKAAAGALHVLQWQWEETGITPNLFPDLGDKEYAAETARALRQNCARIAAELSPQETREMNVMLSAIRVLPDLDRYITWHPIVEDYHRAWPVYQQTKNWHGCGPIVLLFAITGMALLILPAMCATITGLFAGELAVMGALVGLVLTGGTLVGGALLIDRKADRKRFNPAKEAVERCRREVDREEYEALRTRFGGDMAFVRQQAHKAEETVRGFFAGVDLAGVIPLEATVAGSDTSAIPVDSPAPTRGHEPTRAGSQPAEAPCIACRRTIPAEAAFCPFCGAKQQALARDDTLNT